MITPDRRDQLALPGSFAYLESDVPPGVTLPRGRRWRAAEVAPNTKMASGGDSRAGRAAEDRARRAGLCARGACTGPSRSPRRHQ